MESLRIGMSSEAVMSLQQLLAAIGLLGGAPTGSFDTVTQRAVIELQRRAGLVQTGVVDEATWNALYQMQATSLVAPGPVTVGPAPSAPRSNGVLFAGLLAAGAYWFANRDRFKQGAATAEYDEDEDDEEDDDEDFEDDDQSAEAVGDYEDAVTDSLLEEPARLSRSGNASDCKKAAMRLMRVQALAQRADERALYNNTVKKVVDNCRGEADVVEKVVEEEAARQEEVIEDLISVIGQTAERERSKDSDRDANIEERRKAQALYRPRKRDARDDGPAIETNPNREQSRRKLYESGFRKVKAKLTRKTTTEPEKERSGAGKGQGHRRGASAVKVRRGGKQLFKMRKEKAKTKRGFTWRKEND